MTVSTSHPVAEVAEQPAAQTGCHVSEGGVVTLTPPPTIVPRHQAWAPFFLDEESRHAFELASETACYRQLIAAGGRPSHDITLAQTVLTDPGPHDDIVSYWRHGRDPAFGQVFEAQLSDWTAFQEEQLGNRREDYFPRHCLNVQWLLRYYDYRGTSYQLRRDVQTQDKLSTWVEYLAYHIVPYGKLRAAMDQARASSEAAVAAFLASPHRRAPRPRWPRS